MTSNISDYINQYENSLFFACGPIEHGFWRYFKDVEGQTDTQAITSVIRLILLVKEQIPTFRDIRYKNISQYLENLQRDMPLIPSWIKMKVMRECIDTAHDDPKNDKPFRIALKVLNLSPRQQYKCLQMLYEKVDPSLMDSSLADVLDKEVLIQFAYDCSKENVKPKRLVQFWELYGVSSEERLEQLINELNTREHKDLLDRVRNWKSFGLTEPHAENFICEAFLILDPPYLAKIIADLASYEFTTTMLISLFKEHVCNASNNFLQINPSQLQALGCSDDDLQTLFKESVYFLRKCDFPLSGECLAKWNLSQEFIDRSLLICDELPKEQVVSIALKYLSQKSMDIIAELQNHPQITPHMLLSVPKADQPLVLRALWHQLPLKVGPELFLIAIKLDIPEWMKDELLYRVNVRKVDDLPELLSVITRSVSKESALAFCKQCIAITAESEFQRGLTALKGSEILFDLCLYLSELNIDLSVFIELMPHFGFSSEQSFRIWENMSQHRRHYKFEPEFFRPLLKLSLPSEQLLKIFMNAIWNTDEHFLTRLLALAFSTPLDQEARMRLLKECLQTHKMFFQRMLYAHYFEQKRPLSFSEKELCCLAWAKSGEFFRWYEAFHYLRRELEVIANQSSSEFHLQFLVAIFSHTSTEELTPWNTDRLWSFPQFAQLRSQVLELLLWVPRFDNLKIPLLQSSG